MPDTITTAHATGTEATSAIDQLLRELATEQPAAILFFSSTDHDGGRIAHALCAAYPSAQVIGCTTAGEFTERETGTGGIAAIALPCSKATRAAGALADFEQGVEEGVAGAVAELERQLGGKLSELDPAHHVGLVLIDGTHGVEERVNELLGNAAPFLSFIGGSAGDDLKFAETHVFAGEVASSSGAALLVLELKVPYAIVKTCSFAPTGTRFRVTRVDVDERIVWELDGRPAVQAYADALGVTPAGLDSSAFMRSPVGLMIDGEPWIRSPQQVVDGGGLKFYCQILDGIDIDLMQSTDLIGETRNAFRNAAHELGDAPAGGVLFNCILRRLEIDAEGHQGAFLDAIGVCPMGGFHTYGESYVGHINQTLTGLLIG
ncbi:MAG: FIST N-terminal domain-containing protein [Solirubrobacteraceae bacterium]|jgi:hypothetical protein